LLIYTTTWILTEIIEARALPPEATTEHEQRATAYRVPVIIK
jgi:hypothetical protein